jgi:hypothetical protein
VLISVHPQLILAAAATLLLTPIAWFGSRSLLKIVIGNNQANFPNQDQS